MIQVEKFTFSPFQENTYVLHDATGECVIIDPGCYESFERDALRQFVEESELKPVALLNTHCHIDHVFGNAYVNRTWGLGLQMHELDIPTLHAAPAAAHLYGIPGFEPSPEPASFLAEGDKVTFGDSELDILFVPGHAPGHIVFISHPDKFVINGDVLFQGSIGRTDLPGGSFEVLEQSIRTKMYQLPDDYLVYTGHGPETTIGDEKRMNPFVRA